MSGFRIGQGFDAHRFGEGRRLVLGGVDIPCDQGLVGHSDADVLTHAVMDAVLGALCEGDIGIHFPSEDGRYKDARSLELASQVALLMRSKGHEVVQIDATVIAQKPRLQDYIKDMRKNLAECFGSGAENISIKATTTDRMGFIGREEGIAAMAVALLKND